MKGATVNLLILRSSTLFVNQSQDIASEEYMNQIQCNGNSGTTSKIYQRLIWIDCLRGLAAITVVFYHMLIELQNKSAVKLIMLNGIVNPGRISVFLFFMISGYVIRISTIPYAAINDTFSNV